MGYDYWLTFSIEVLINSLLHIIDLVADHILEITWYNDVIVIQ